MVNQSHIRHTRWIVNFLHITLLIINLIRNIRYGSNYIHVKLAVQTFLYNFHMKQSQETATETKT